MPSQLFAVGYDEPVLTDGDPSLPEWTSGVYHYLKQLCLARFQVLSVDWLIVVSWFNLLSISCSRSREAWSVKHQSALKKERPWYFVRFQLYHLSTLVTYTMVDSLYYICVVALCYSRSWRGVRHGRSSTPFWVLDISCDEKDEDEMSVKDPGLQLVSPQCLSGTVVLNLSTTNRSARLAIYQPISAVKLSPWSYSNLK
jgi:hypothetical protein